MPKPTEGERDPETGRKYVAGRWRTTAEIHSMARYSVVETLKLFGPLSRESLMSKTGLAELDTKRAITSLLEDGKISTAGQNRFYVRETD